MLQPVRLVSEPPITCVNSDGTYREKPLTFPNRSFPSAFSQNN